VRTGVSGLVAGVPGLLAGLPGLLAGLLGLLAGLGFSLGALRLVGTFVVAVAAFFFAIMAVSLKMGKFRFPKIFMGKRK